MWNSIQSESQDTQLNVSEAKIKQFQRGQTTFINLKQKKQQELERKKKDQENLETAKAYAEFVKSFEIEDNTSTGSFVKGGTLPGQNTSNNNRGRTMHVRDEEDDSHRVGLGASLLSGKKTAFVSSSNKSAGTSSLLSRGTTFVSAGASSKSKNKHNKPAGGGLMNAFSNPLTLNKKNGKKKKQPKKKRNIELFMEEMMSEETEPKGGGKRFKGESGSAGALPLPGESGASAQGHHDTGDPTSTNLYVGNLAPAVTEAILINTFGIYGDIASVKIMWPRTEEEHRRGRNCGFVSFMHREDAEEALHHLRDEPILGQPIRCGWSKTVTLPAVPLAYKLRKGETWKPNQAGATATPEEVPTAFAIPTGAVKYEIQFPTDRTLRRLIDRLAVYVARLGHIFEKCIMEKERNNPRFSFLFDVKSSEHLYYRWKTYSLAQRDSVSTWRSTPFQMMISGPFWVPPSRVVDPPTQSHRESRDRDKEGSRSREDRERDRDSRRERDRRKRREDRTKLRSADVDKLEALLRNLTSERRKIKELMGFALDHSEEAKEVVEILTESLSLDETPIPKKLARLFAVSDILYNSSAPVRNASAYRSHLQQSMPQIFAALHSCYAAIDGRITANAMKEKVQSVLRVWQAWSVFPEPFLTKLEYKFLGLDIGTSTTEESGSATENTSAQGPATTLLGSNYDSDNEEDLNGEPLEEGGSTPPYTHVPTPPLTIQPLLTKSLAITTPAGTTVTSSNNGLTVDDDIDGVPLDDEDLDGIPL